MVANGDHRTRRGATVVLEFLERRLESVRSIPVLRREADMYIEALAGKQGHWSEVEHDDFRKLLALVPCLSLIHI